MYFSFTEQIILIFLIFATGISFTYDVWKRLHIVMKGSGSLPLDRIRDRLWRTFREVFIHERVIRDRFWPGLMHALVFWGFLVFGLVTVDHFTIGFGISLFPEAAKHVYTIVAISFAFMVMIGILSLAYRRFIIRPPTLGNLSMTSGLVTIFITLLMVSYIFGEITLPVNLEKINWWLHSLIILAFLVLIPRSKHLHLVFAPFNIFFRPFNTPDHKAVSIDLDVEEEELDAMLSDLTRLTKNQALDIFSCVECGRCTDVCPAHRGGGILDPKNHFILDLRQPILNSGDVNVLNDINVGAGWELSLIHI